VHLHYDNPLGRLTDIKRVVNNEAVETLTQYRYDEHGQLSAVINRNGDTVRSFSYADGLMVTHSNALGLGCHYRWQTLGDKPRVVEHWTSDGEHYHFRYDLDSRTSWATDVLGRELQVQYNADHRVIGYGENAERPERHTLFERDAIGRLIAKINRDASQTFAYDDGDRLLSIARQPTGIGKQLGVTEEKLEYTYDLLGRLTKEITPAGTLGYEYDPLSNLTTLTLPDGRKVNHLYYGSGHLHQLNLDGLVISEMERDDLHREVYRTQGKLTSCFGYDAMGRKAWQFASTLPADKLSQVHNAGVNTSLLVEHAYNPIHRRYQYDPAGELVRTLDKLRGEIKYEYEANGQLRSRDTGSLVGSEEFRYDAAANRLDLNAQQFAKVKDNRIKQWRDQEYRYDPWGNLIEKRSGHSKLQSFSYDCENRLVRAETLVNGKLESQGEYRYDGLGRRVAKQAEINGELEQKRFLWQGLRMLREETPAQSILYLYEPGSYAPLARVDQVEGEGQKLYYFHTDQIGTPLELTDSEGKIVWQATYRSWGTIETLSIKEVDQNLRYPGQYSDDETSLHYNTFRYYDPEVARFITQDPIGLLGGSNLYNYAPSSTGWLDPLGWCVKTNVIRGPAGQPLRAAATITLNDLKQGGTATNATSRAWARMMGNSDDDAGHIIGKLLGGSGGKDGVFPQLKGINRGQFRAFEAQIANVIKKKGAVDVELNFVYGNGGRDRLP